MGRAFTLVEVLVTAALALLLLGMLAFLFIHMEKPARRGQAQIQLDQSALILQRRLQADLSQVARPSLHLEQQSDHVGLGLQTLVEVDADSQQSWSDDWIFYRWSRTTGVLNRWMANHPASDTHHPQTLTPAELSSWLASPAPSSRLAESLRALQIENSPRGWVGVDAYLQVEVAGRNLEVRRNFVVWLRNNVL